MIFAKIFNDILPDMKFVVEYDNKNKKPKHVLLRNEEIYFDIGYNEDDENYKIPNNKYHDALVKDLFLQKKISLTFRK